MVQFLKKKTDIPEILNVKLPVFQLNIVCLMYFLMSNVEKIHIFAICSFD